MKFLQKSLNSLNLTLTLSIIFALFPPVFAEEPSPETGEPHYSVIDNNHVNIMNGGLHYTIKDLSIGTGNLRLEHSITVSGRDVAGSDNYYYGYKDSYMGGIKSSYQTLETTNDRKFEVLQVTDFEGVVDFITDSSGRFLPLGDASTTLEKIDSTTLVLTKKSGVQVFFYSDTPIPAVPTVLNMPLLSMGKIEYPNGFAITIYKESHQPFSKIMSVNTNNGLQLRYIYEPHNRPLESAKQSATNNPQVRADSLNFSNHFPTKIVALNNAVETCPVTGNSCSITGDWPEVRYEWPDGMPRAMYIGTSVFKVHDMAGATTEFYHKAHKIDNGGNISYTPRITKLNDNKGLDITYVYQMAPKDPVGSQCNICVSLYSPGYTYQWIMTESINNGVTRTYDFLRGGRSLYPGYGVPTDSVMTYGGGLEPIISAKITNQYEYNDQAKLSVPFEIETWEKVIELERDFANKPHTITSKLTGLISTYLYDSMGRIKTVDNEGLKQDFTYPYSYTGGCDTSHRFCHKPVNISNKYFFSSLKKNTTYSYHYESGEVATITSPKDSKGVSPKIQHSYQQFYARYKNISGAMINASSPIWLRTSTISCKNSKMTNSVCAGNDKITKVFEYGTGDGNNLFMIGETLTEQGESQSRTTCYTYDKYGNPIGEIKPKAGISCNSVRGY